ncbi:hypothetical protein D9M68_742540 [compost metagenome]
MQVLVGTQDRIKQDAGEQDETQPLEQLYAFHLLDGKSECSQQSVAEENPEPG